MTILTRNDVVGNWQPYDSIKWALEIHLKEPDTGEYNYGILHGNEDCPLRIQLWKQDPEWKTPCDRDWRPQQHLLSKDGKTKYLVSRNFPEPDDTISETNIGL